MIESIEELGKVLRYKHTDETYDEVINRYSDIISSWHATHTTMLYKLKQHIKDFPEQDHYANYNRDATYQNWFDELKMIVVDKK